MQWWQNHQSWELSPCPHIQLLAHHTNDRNLESAVTWTAASKPKTQRTPPPGAGGYEWGNVIGMKPETIRSRCLLQQQPSDKNSGNTWVHGIQMQRRRRRRRSSGSIASWARRRRSRVRLFVPCQLWSPLFEWRSSRDRCSSDLRC
jgi:hypothetical protein